MTSSHEAHHHPNYWAIFILLCIGTAVSFITVSDYWTFSHQAGVTLVMIVAVIKATLVAVYFMHLKYDWFKVYGMVVAALILGTILMIALLPDITYSVTRLLPDNPAMPMNFGG